MVHILVVIPHPLAHWSVVLQVTIDTVRTATAPVGSASIFSRICENSKKVVLWFTSRRQILWKFGLWIGYEPCSDRLGGWEPRLKRVANFHTRHPSAREHDTTLWQTELFRPSISDPFQSYGAGLGEQCSSTIVSTRAVETYVFL